MASLTIAGSALAALAAKPEKAKTYSGTVERSGTSISFKLPSLLTASLGPSRAGRSSSMS
jgi:hypothetical protein